MKPYRPKPYTTAGREALRKVAALASWTTNDDLVAELRPLIAKAEDQSRRSLLRILRGQVKSLYASDQWIFEPEVQRLLDKAMATATPRGPEHE